MKHHEKMINQSNNLLSSNYSQNVLTAPIMKRREDGTRKLNAILCEGSLRNATKDMRSL